MLVKAVIVVGGPSFGDMPMRGASTIPALEPVANRPIIHHVLDGYRAASISGVILAGDPDTLNAVSRCLHGYDHGLDDLEYAMCERGLDAGATIRSVAPLIGDRCCILQPGDGLLGEPVGSLLEGLTHEGPDLILPFADLTDPLDAHPGTLAPAWKGAITGSSSPRNGTFKTASAGTEVAVFGPGAFERATKLFGETEPADLAVIAERLAADGGSVRFQLIESWRRYNGNGSDLLELNRVALDGLRPNVRPSLRSDNRIEGRVFIHPTASAVTSVIVGPTVIGEGASVENAYIGPYTSVGAGARVEGAEVERSIISPGASVMHIGGRLVSSLVGRDARVFRDFSLPRAMRLWVGQGDEVALC